MTALSLAVASLTALTATGGTALAQVGVATPNVPPATANPSSPPVVAAPPVTAPPVTSAPVTSAPVTSAPVTSAPVTSAPVTSAPVTSAPVVRAPTAAEREANGRRQLFVASDRDGHAASVQALCFTPDGRRLLSGGHDKRALVWDWNAGTVVATHRWLAEEGLFGAVRAVEVFARPDGTTAAVIGGYGGTDRIGDLQWVDVNDDSREPLHYEPAGPDGAAAVGHRAVIHDLSVSPSGTTAASVDDAGRVLVRSQAPFGPARELRAAVQLPQGDGWLPIPRWPVALVGETDVVAPAPGPAPHLWKLHLLSTNGGGTELALPGGAFWVTALAASPVGDRFAAAYVDAAGKTRVLVWIRRPGGAWAFADLPIPPGAGFQMSLAFSADGSQLAGAGEATDPSAGSAVVWDVRTGAVSLTLGAVADRLTPPSGCALSPDGRTLALAQGNDVQIWDVPTKRLVRTLVGGPRFDRVAFDPADPRDGGTGYSIVTQVAATREAPATAFRFAPKRQRLVPAPLPGPADRRGAEIAAGLTLEPYAGPATCFRLIPAQRGRSAEAVAVGTAHGALFVYAADGSNRLLRTFWGHQDRLNDVAVAPDGRYLATASDDGTVRFWSLDDLPDPAAPDRDADAALKRLWGLEIERAPEGGRVRVTAVAENAYLHRKGIRSADLLRTVAAVREGAPAFATFEQVRDELSDVPWHEQTNWRFDRQGQPLPPATRVARPVFMPTLTLAVEQGRGDGWVAWHPDGYFMYAGGGANRIGWQENRGAGERPAFLPFSAVQRRYHRPQAVSRLLEAGAWQAAEEAAPAESDLPDEPPPQAPVKPPVVPPVVPPEDAAPPPRDARPRIDMASLLSVSHAAESVLFEATLGATEGDPIQSWAVRELSGPVVASEQFDPPRATATVRQSLPYLPTAEDPGEKGFALEVVTASQRRFFQRLIVLRDSPPEQVVSSPDVSLEWLTPSLSVRSGGGAGGEGRVVNSLDLPVRVRVTPRQGQTIDALRFRVNGRYGASAPALPTAGDAGVYEATLRLAPGPNRIVAEVEMREDRIPLGDAPIDVRAEAIPEEEGYPQLWVLAAGVERYAPPLGRLALANDDAQRVARFYDEGGRRTLTAGGHYSEVNVTLLEDAGAEDLDRAWRRISGKVGEGDTVLFLFSGHGVRAAGARSAAGRGGEVGERFYLMLADASEGDFGANSLSARELVEHAVAVRNKACQVVILIDACHSGALIPQDGAFLGEEDLAALTSSSTDLTAAASAVGAKTGIAVLCSSSGDAYSFEGREPITNGLFTWAVASILDGSALSPPPGHPNLADVEMSLAPGAEISLSAVRNYVQKTVPRLFALQGLRDEGGTQRPVFYDMSGVDPTSIILSRWP
nr:caspase family protein [Alienimonas californiensis]